MNNFEPGYYVRWKIDNFLFFNKYAESIAESPKFKFIDSDVSWRITLSICCNSLIVGLRRDFCDYAPYKVECKSKLEFDNLTVFMENDLTFERNDSSTLLCLEAEKIEGLFDSRNFLLFCHFKNESSAQNHHVVFNYFLDFVQTVKVKCDWLIPNFNTLPNEELSFQELGVCFSPVKIYNITFNYEHNANLLIAKVTNTADSLDQLQFSIILFNCHGKFIGFAEQISINSVDKLTTISFKLKGNSKLPIGSDLPDNILNISIEIEGSIGEVISYYDRYIRNESFVRKGESVTELGIYTHLHLDTLSDTFIIDGDKTYSGFARGFLMMISDYFTRKLRDTNAIYIPNYLRDVSLLFSTLKIATLPDFTSFDFISSLFIKSRKLEIRPLIKASSRIVLSALTIENICDVFVMLNVCDEPDVRKMTQHFFNVNVKQILKSNEWKFFVEKEPRLAYDIVHTAFETELRESNLCSSICIYY